MKPEENKTLRIAAAVLGTSVLLILYYSLDRTRAGLFDPGPDPATVIASGRSDYLWRVAICAYLTPIVFSALYLLGRGREEKLWTLVSRALLPVVLVAAILSVAFP